MAEENENDEPELDENDEESEGKGKKGLLFIIIGVVLLALIGGGAFFFLSGGEENTEDTPIEEHAENSADGENAEGTAKAEDDGKPVFYDLPEFLVDLNTSGRGKTSFLKMKITVELAKQSDVELMEAYMPRVRDNFITYIRELRASDLSGSAGLYRLREELMLRINQAIAPAKVNNILFKEIIVQ